MRPSGRVALMKWESYLPQSNSLVRSRPPGCEINSRLTGLNSRLRRWYAAAVASLTRAVIYNQMKEHDGLRNSYDDAVAFLEKTSSVISRLLT